MEGLMQLGIEITADDAQVVYEEPSQKDMKNKAIQSVAKASKDTFAKHRRKAEHLVKIHLDNEAWYQVTVKPNDVSD